MREDICYLPHYDFLFKPGEHLEEGCHDVPGHVLRLEPGVAEAEEHEAVLSVLDEVGDVQGQRVGGLWWCTVITMILVGASTFKTRLVYMKLGHQHNYHKGRAAKRHYANHPARLL